MKMLTITLTATTKSQYLPKILHAYKVTSGSLEMAEFISIIMYGAHYTPQSSGMGERFVQTAKWL